jgi:hypothetical protein
MAKRRPKTILSLGGLAVIMVILGLSGVFDWSGPGDGGAEEETPGLSVPSEGTVTSEGTDAPGTSGHPESAAPATPPAGPLRPLEVMIEGRDYLVGADRCSLDGIVEMAQKVPAGEGPAVVIRRTASSRASAEESLRGLLRRTGIDFEWRDDAARDEKPGSEESNDV